MRQMTNPQYAPQALVAAQTLLSEDSVFCLQTHDSALFDRALGAITGDKPNRSLAALIVKTLRDKRSAGYRLSSATAELLELAEEVAG